MPKTLMTVAVMAAVGLVAYAVIFRGGAASTSVASSTNDDGKWWEAVLAEWASPDTWLS